MKYDYLVVGAGLFGAVFTYEAKKRGKSVLVIDRRDHIAGNVYTENVHGINVHRYGAHIFHTSNKEVWDYVNQFAEFNNYINSPIAIYKDELYNLPFNMNTFSKLWGIRTPAEAQAKIAASREKSFIIGRAEKPGGAGSHPGGPRHLPEAGQGLHRETVGPRLQRASGFHHQTSSLPFHLRQQLFQRSLSGNRRWAVTRRSSRKLLGRR